VFICLNVFNSIKCFVQYGLEVTQNQVLIYIVELDTKSLNNFQLYSSNLIQLQNTNLLKKNHLYV